MRYWAPSTALVVLFALSLQAADGLSGTWTVGTGQGAQVVIFKVQEATFTGIICGPCDDPSSVFRIEDGRLVDGQRVTFFINYDVGGPRFRQYGPYRDRVSATLAKNQLTMEAQREGDADGPITTTVLKRVVENFEFVPKE